MKIFKIILANIVLLLLIFVCIETFYARKWEVKSFEKYKDIFQNTMLVDVYYDKLFKRMPVQKTYNKSFRKDINTSVSNKKPVLFIGCSFARGDGLEENQTISYKLGQLTGRPVYNRALSGAGLDNFLYLSRNEKFYQTIPEPEFLIYIWINDHINRIRKFKIEPSVFDFQPSYKELNNHLIEKKPHFYDKLFSVSNFQYYYNYKFNTITDRTVKLYFTEAEKEIHKHWKNTKLVILLYPTYENENNKGRKLWKELSLERYKIIDIKDLTDVDLTKNEYRCDGWHPKAQVWDMLLPDIIKILHLNES